MTTIAALLAAMTLTGAGPQTHAVDRHMAAEQKIICRWNADSMKWNDCRTLAVWKEFDATQPPLKLTGIDRDITFKNDFYVH